MTSVDELRQNLTEFQKELLDEIAHSFLATGKGVVALSLHLQWIKKAKKTKGEIIQAIKGFGGCVIFEMEEHQPGNRYYPTFLGLLLCTKGKTHEELVARYLEYIESVALNDSERQTIKSEEVENALKLSKHESAILLRLLSATHTFLSSYSVTADGITWQSQIPREVDDLPSWNSKKEFVQNLALRNYDPNKPVMASEARIYGDGGPVPVRRGSANVAASFSDGFEMAPDEPPAKPRSKDVFVVHGRDEFYRESVAGLLKSAGLNPIILHERPNLGQTIIEKFIKNANVGFAVVILSADDVGRLAAADEAPLEPRARQNVILELGFFLGKLGREKVCALCEPNVTVPSDYDGVVYVKLDDGGDWKRELLHELEAACLISDTAVRAILDSQLIIHSAIYGREGKTIDVTEAVRLRVTNGQTELTSGNHLGGDPCHGVGKVLELEYSVGAAKHKRTIPEGGVIQLLKT